MRSFLTILLALLALSSAAARAEVPIGTQLTVVVDFDHSSASNLEGSLDEMYQETRRLLKPTGVALDFRRRDEWGATDSAEDLVLFRITGTCRMGDYAMLFDERGILGWSHTVDGQVLPFGRISCDQVRRIVDPEIARRGRADRDRLFGRAMARVMAHEIFHMVGRTHSHGKSGFIQASLSGRELIADKLDLSRKDQTLLKTTLSKKLR